MNRFLLIAVVVCLTMMTAEDCAACRKQVVIPLSQIHTDAAFRQFKKASAPNQREVIDELVGQVEEQYDVCHSVDEFETLRVQVEYINRYIDGYRWSFFGLRKNYMLSEKMQTELLHQKIVAKVCELRGGVMVFTEAGEYHDFGQKVK